MNWINDTIREFGISIGIHGLALDATGMLDLDLPNNARLRITALKDPVIPEVILSRGESLPYPSRAILLKSLQMNDFRNSANWPIQTGLSDQHLWISVRIPERAFVIKTLEQGFLELKRLHENLKLIP